MLKTLEDTAALNIAVHLFNDPQFREELLEVDGNRWQKIMHDKLSELFVPVTLYEKMWSQIRHVAWEIIFRNIRYHKVHEKVSQRLEYQCKCFKGILHSNYRWTSCEYFDENKTIQALIQDKQLDLPFRFVLSCENDLEDSIIGIWGEMPQKLKYCFYRDNLPFHVKRWVKLLIIAENAVSNYYPSNLKDEVHQTLRNFEKYPFMKFRFEFLSPADWADHQKIHSFQAEYEPGVNYSCKWIKMQKMLRCMWNFVLRKNPHSR
ncbi:hypothetical protein HNY73_018753 [Argiope bruennichi]|uniref:Uncharacterized protein n=1 Tax=Argiope bruennichi TaxID=94029 RepID=A0A8T0EHB8_ARGBR|nr:hypothetical protein HNY73_018753 [Argiope bruennichi]